MLRANKVQQHVRRKSTLSSDLPLSFDKIPVPPEIGFGKFQSSFPYFAKGDGFARLPKQFQKLHREHGPIARFRFLPFTPYVVSVADPNAVAHVYRSEGKMPQRTTMLFMELYRKERGMPSGSGLATEYDEWKKYRASMNDHLLQVHNIPLWLSHIDEVAQDVTARIKGEAADKNGLITITAIIKAFALESTSSIVFGRRMGCITRDWKTPIDAEAEKLIAAVDGFFSTTQRSVHLPPYIPLSLYPYLPMYKEHVVHTDYLFKVGRQMAQERIKTKEMTQNDLLTLFLLRPELTESEAIIQALEIIFAGVDSMSASILWAIYAIASAPNSSEIQAKIRDEVNLALENKSTIDEEALRQFPYIRACVKEALRLHPPASPTVRYAPEDITIMGYNVPKGTLIMMSTYAMSRDPNVFDDPDTFIPERWLKRDDTSKRYLQAHATIPFGMGPRGCVGRRLAETQMIILLAHIVRNIELQWPSSESPLQGVMQVFFVPEKPVTISCQPVST